MIRSNNNRERSDGPAISVSSTDGRAVAARTQCLHYTCSVLKKKEIETSLNLEKKIRQKYFNL